MVEQMVEVSGDDLSPAASGVGRLVEARLRLALEAAGMGLWDWDLVSGRLVWDERSAQMYGTTLQKSSGSIADVETRVHPDDLEYLRSALSGAIDVAGAVDVEFRVVWPDGSVHCLYGRGQALTGPGGLVERVIGVNVDVTEVRSQAHERTVDAARMAGLVAVAQALGGADTEQAVLEVVTRRGVTVLGAQRAVLVLRHQDGGTVRSLVTSLFHDQLVAQVAVLPADFPLPMVHAATTGTAWYLPDRAAAQATFPGADALYAQSRTQGSAAVPLLDGDRLVGSLAIAFDAAHTWRPAERDLLEALAALTAQAIVRVRAVAAERGSLRAAQGMSETLQRSLLTEPPVATGLQVAVRYLPATEQAQVGGDWYDAFATPHRGGLTLVIGDVAGHDRTAAAAMAQVRNVLRGVAQVIGDPPAAVLSALDQAMRGLELDALTSAVLCNVEPDGAGLTLRWSNAGHPPPLLLSATGAGSLLHTPPDLLLGLDPSTDRADHHVALPPGSTIILYTDGLVERRGENLDEGLLRLQQLATELAGQDVESLADTLLDRLAQEPDDDVALLILRVAQHAPVLP